MVRREVRETGRGTSRGGPSGRPIGHPACRPLRISPFFLGHGNAAGVQCVFRRAGRGPGRRGQRSSGKSRLRGWTPGPAATANGSASSTSAPWTKSSTVFAPTA